MRNPLLLMPFLLSPLFALPQYPGEEGAAQRRYQVAVLERIALPVLEAGARGSLTADIPGCSKSRRAYAGLEALGRTLAGIAPWLELGPGDDAEGQARARLIHLSVDAIGQAVDPASPGFLNFTQGGQPLVDASFLAHALLRAPNQLWGNLPESARNQTLDALRSTRSIKPFESNWLLFSATIEMALLRFSGECDFAPVEYAVGRHLDWYKGDGIYGDGPHFAWDYYNSFVIQPMLLDVVEVLASRGHPLGEHLPAIRARALRQASQLEQMISPEGTFPVIGRSSCYRFGALQMLSLAALRRELPAGTSPGAVRAALTAVIHRMLSAEGTFDEQGWLTVGVVGSQPRMAEPYICTGSVYLCTFGLLQLGLPPEDPFWTAPSEPWTQKRIWSGMDTVADKALK